MGAFINRAFHEFRVADNKAVLKELMAAGIPFVKLPDYLHSEVKTSYIGLLNGFLFVRAWRYWACMGDMEMEAAMDIFQKMGQLGVRADGHADIDRPPQGYSPQLDRRYKEAANQLREENRSVAEVLQALEAIQEEINEADYPRYVQLYHIDTTEGLKAFADYLREHHIYVRNGAEGSFAAELAAKEEAKVDHAGDHRNTV